MNRKYNILIVYVMGKWPMRATLWDHLYSFRDYSKHNCFYLNLSVRSVPSYLRRVKFDLIVFDTLFLANRIRDEWFTPALEKARALKDLEAVKIVLPQDEHTHTNTLMDFIEEFRVDVVFSVGPAAEWPKIYDRIDFERVKFYNVLTGYLNAATVRRIDKLARSRSGRDIDVGYRTWRAGPWLGRHGLLRHEVAELFQEKARERRFTTDISTRNEDTFWGDDWYKFLLRCKYTISVEGGSSLLDRDGKLQERIEDYQRQHPQAEFNEIERACFPGLDGMIRYVALSPRHLECCSTRTCQILVEGEYNGSLKPGRHYIELKRDFSNVAEVLEQMESDELRQEIAERAYREIVASGKYTYQSFVDLVLEKSLPEESSVEAAAAPARPPRAPIVYYWMRLSETISWVQVALHLHSFIPRLKGFVRKALVRLFSEQSVVSTLGRAKPRKKRTD